MSLVLPSASLSLAAGAPTGCICVSSVILLSLKARVGSPLLLVSGARRAVAIARVAVDVDSLEVTAHIARVGYDVWSSLGACASATVSAIEGSPTRAASLEWCVPAPGGPTVVDGEGHSREAVIDVDSLARAAARAAAAAPVPALVAALLHGRVLAADQVVALPLLGGGGSRGGESCVRVRDGSGAGAAGLFVVDVAATSALVHEWVDGQGEGEGAAIPPSRAALVDTVDAALPGARAAVSDLVNAITYQDGTPRAGGVIVTGAHGVGKSALVRELLKVFAGRDGIPTFCVSTASLYRATSCTGDAEARLQDLSRALSNVAASRGGSRTLPRVLVDDAHELLPARPQNGQAVRVRGALFDLLDEWTPRALIVALTARPDALSAAALAPSRFRRAIAMPLPTAAERSAQAAAIAARGGGPFFDETGVALSAAANAHGASRADVDALLRSSVMGLSLDSRGMWGNRGRVGVGDGGGGGGGVGGIPAGPPLSIVSRGARDATFSAIAGLLAPLSAAHILRVENLTPSRMRGLLITGETGTGKTALACALLRAASANGLASVRALRATDLLSARVGETEAALAAAFTDARKASPALLLIDGIDALLPARKGMEGEDSGGEDSGGWARRLLATLLAELDGAASGGVALVATAMSEQSVDAALKRPGRLDGLVELGAPTPAERGAMLDDARAQRGAGVAAAAATRDDAGWPSRRARLVAATEGASRARVVDTWRRAAMCALRRLAGGGGAACPFIDVNDDDIAHALQENK